MRPRAPRIEGSIVLDDGRRLAFAEFGVPNGKPIFWFHGTPGARRQIPPEARAAAEERGVRLIGIDRPGVGDSTPHIYPSFTAWAHDMAKVADRMGIGRFGLIGLSGGGPYVLACAHALPERVVAADVLGGVAPARGPEAAPGGLIRFAANFAPVYRLLHEPIGVMLTLLAWGARPFAERAIELVARLSPAADRDVFARPEMKAFFLDDLLHGSRWGLRAPVYDLLLFSRPWSFHLRDIRVPVRFWHGDHDHLVPFSHAQHQAKLVPGSELRVRHGESHLGGLAAAREILDAILALWPEEGGARQRRSVRTARARKAARAGAAMGA
jgi:pimeloyl-ACP methyl ester carboxylesterase